MCKYRLFKCKVDYPNWSPQCNPCLSRDAKGNLIGSEAKGKYGTPKCEFIAQLLWVAEPENAPGCWIGAHPSLGEKLAHALLSGGHIKELPPIVDIKREVR